MCWIAAFGELKRYDLPRPGTWNATRRSIVIALQPITDTVSSEGQLKAREGCVPDFQSKIVEWLNRGRGAGKPWAQWAAHATEGLANCNSDASKAAVAGPDWWHGETEVPCCHEHSTAMDLRLQRRR